MRRREFISLLGGAAAGWPVVARAQQPAMPMIAFLHSEGLGDTARRVTAFRQGLNETDHIEGQNVAIGYYSAEHHADRLQALVVEMIRRPPLVIVCNGIAALTVKA